MRSKTFALLVVCCAALGVTAAWAQCPQGCFGCEPRTYCDGNCKECLKAGLNAVWLSPEDAKAEIDFVGDVAPADPWAPGTQYRIIVAPIPRGVIQNVSNPVGHDWGSEKDERISVQAAQALITLRPTADPNLREIAVDTFNMFIPSFEHTSLSPESTGGNTFFLQDAVQSRGTIDTKTGAFSVKVMAAFTNLCYKIEDPGMAMLDLTGDVSILSQTATLKVNGIAYY